MYIQVVICETRDREGGDYVNRPKWCQMCRLGPRWVFLYFKSCFFKKLTYILLHIQLLSTKQAIGNDARYIVCALHKFFSSFFFLILLIFYCIYISFNLRNSMHQDGQRQHKGPNQQGRRQAGAWDVICLKSPGIFFILHLVSCY